MGLFDKLFRKDPAAELRRAEELLAAGRAYDALHAARRAEAAAAGPDGDGVRLRAREVEGLAREVLVASALEEADRAEADEDYDDAAEWVASALEYLTSGGAAPPLAAELRRRHQGLRARAREAARQPLLLRREEEGEGGEPPGPDPLDLETRFGTLVGTLDEEVADGHYLHRPIPFQQAYVDLNEGRLEEALAAFDALAAAEPDDAVVRLERGRARLLAGDPARAREDFEAAWPALGDGPLDAAGELSVPALWAGAALGAGEPRAVAERLADLAGPGGDDPQLLALRAHALLEVDGEGPDEAALEEARALLQRLFEIRGGKLSEEEAELVAWYRERAAT
jgi:predicted Zn-dependent protease